MTTRQHLYERGKPARRRTAGGKAILAIVVLALAADLILVARYMRYQEETARLRSGMTKAQRDRADAVVAGSRAAIGNCTSPSTSTVDEWSWNATVSC